MGDRNPVSCLCSFSHAQVLVQSILLRCEIYEIYEIHLSHVSCVVWRKCGFFRILQFPLKTLPNFCHTGKLRFFGTISNKTKLSIWMCTAGPLNSEYSILLVGWVALSVGNVIYQNPWRKVWVHSCVVHCSFSHVPLDFVYNQMSQKRLQMSQKRYQMSQKRDLTSQKKYQMSHVSCITHSAMYLLILCIIIWVKRDFKWVKRDIKWVGRDI